MAPVTREATHAGSWYSDDEHILASQLDQWLDDVPPEATCIGPISQPAGETAQFPTPGANMIMSPHAGYSYSGKAAAWAYKAADWSNAKRIIILGPSHHHYLTRCALSICTTYETPFGQLPLDLPAIESLRATGQFEDMPLDVDEAEHSIEMQLPYLHRMLQRTSTTQPLPPIIPILVGNLSTSLSTLYSTLLTPLITSPTTPTLTIISTDFAHWGSRFRYTRYEPSLRPERAFNLRSGDRPKEPALHVSIEAVDRRCIGVVEECGRGDKEGRQDDGKRKGNGKGAEKRWRAVLEESGNTVCGRFPVGIALGVLESARSEGDDDGEDDGKGRFKFVRYERSSLCETGKDSSVSYASAFAVL